MIEINNFSISDIRNMPVGEAAALADEIRAFLVDNVPLTGGHLASNLGVVEISLGLLRVFSAPKDKIIYDTGHQSYVHKLLTGRLDVFPTLRQYGGLSGFTKRSESKYDPFGAGHSSTSISAALGFCRAAQLNGEDSRAIAVIGDGAFTGGMIYEALNNIRSTDNLIIVLNDNGMSISKNVGSMSRYLGKIRSDEKYFEFKGRTSDALSSIPVIGKTVNSIARGVKDSVKSIAFRDNMFEQFGINYLGPADGNDLRTVEALFREARRKPGPALIHLHTQKGKGYEPAEKNPCVYHSLGPAGKSRARGELTLSEAFGIKLTSLAKKDERIVAITAAMSNGVGLDKMKECFPERFFDVGIAEQHAMTFSAGLAAGGMLPFFAVYSTFFQRSYDQLMHDIVLQKLKAVVMLDHAGFSEHDGPTHHGLFDISLTLNLPGIEIYAPTGIKELFRAMDEVSVRVGNDYKSPLPAIIRYAKGTDKELITVNFPCREDIEICSGGEDTDAVIVSYGRVTENALLAQKMLAENGIKVSVMKLCKLAPFDSDTFSVKLASLGSIRLVYFLEEGMRCGGFFEYIAAEAACGRIKLPDCPFIIRAIDNQFIPQGELGELYSHAGMSPEKIASEIKEQLR